MKLRVSFFLFILLIVLTVNSFPYNGIFEPIVFKLDGEPLVRIGLVLDSSSVSITTGDTSLAVESPGESRRLLGTTSVRLSSSGYSPPAYEIYRFEIAKIATREEAQRIAGQIERQIAQSASVQPDGDNTFRVRIGVEKHIIEDARDFVAMLSENGFATVGIITEKYTLPSDDAVELTAQIARNPRSEVRSINAIFGTVGTGDVRSGSVQPTASSRPVRQNANAFINPTLREINISGSSAASKFNSLKTVVIGSSFERGIVKLNGKSYRGKMEVFVNSKGRLTVVNVVPMEDYLLGVVPAELSLPQIEAQKAQAVAARTYAVANADGYKDKGFDMVDTVWSQVYKGISIESAMGTQAVLQTRGVVAAYHGKPINALYTSTCGGRTENSGNIFEFDEPYLRGVNCSLDGHEHFAPFTIKTTRPPADIKNEANYAMVQLAAKLSVNNFLMITAQFTDEYFENSPTETELKSWLNQLAVKLGKPIPQFVTQDTAKPIQLATVLAGLIYDDPSEGDTLLSESDINYQLSFLDAGEIPRANRAMLAMLMRDGWFTIYSDLTLKPQKRFSRAKLLRLINHFYEKKKWSLGFETGEARPTEDGKLIIKSGRSASEIRVNPNVFLFRQFGDSFYQVPEIALLGGERVSYKLNGLGEVIYLEMEPTSETTIAEKMSPRTNWTNNQSASTVRANLSRYVNGLGTLIDVRITKQGFSKRAVELEITTTNGKHYLSGGKIRSALRLYEQLFVIDKRYSGDRVVSYSFRGRGWGHGVGMCQYGAYGLAKMGVKYERILKHYYTDVDVARAY